MTIYLLNIELHKDSTSWISILNINDWELFYWEKDPKHAGGKTTFLTIMGIKIFKK